MTYLWIYFQQLDESMDTVIVGYLSLKPPYNNFETEVVLSEDKTAYTRFFIEDACDDDCNAFEHFLMRRRFVR